MRLHVFQHVAFEGPGSIENWANDNGHRITRTQFFANQYLPEPSEIDMLIVMGGPMSTYEEDEFDWLIDEKKFIESYLDTGNPILGVCLGCQLVADILGADVYSARQMEIGWFPVTKTEIGKEADLIDEWPGEETVLHWHGDTFDCPNSAENLIRSKVCENQMFVYRKNVVGIQFHLEMSDEGIESMLSNMREELAESPSVQSTQKIRAELNRVQTLQTRMDHLLDRLSASVKS